MNQQEAELKVKLERIREILLTRLPQHYYDTFGVPLNQELVRSAVLRKHADLMEAAIKEALSHLSPEDVVLAIRHLYSEKPASLTSSIDPPEPKKRKGK